MIGNFAQKNRADKYEKGAIFWVNFWLPISGKTSLVWRSEKEPNGISVKLWLARKRLILSISLLQPGKMYPLPAVFQLQPEE